MNNIGLQDAKLKPLLFSLLSEPEMRDLTVCNLASLMKSIPSEANRNNAAKLFNHYLDLLSKVQADSSDTDFALLIRLLSGISQVVHLSPIPTKKQKLFREAGAFIKVA